MTKKYLYFIAAFLLLSISTAWAGSTTLTTYYPAPTGNYDKLTANNIGIGQSTTTAARLDILAGGDDDNPVIRMRQSNASTYGIDLGIDNAVNGGLVFRTVNNGTSAVVATLDRGNGNFGIGAGMTSPLAKLDVNGTANIWSGSRYAIPNGTMQPGSLTIGNIGANFGGGSGWNANTAGLLLETATNTEIAVHDSGTRIASLLYYEGDGTNRITLGRDMAWGTIASTILNGNVGISTTTPNGQLDIAKNPGNGYLDGIVIGQLNGDNTASIQTYIDTGAGGGYGNWGYAGGCCHPLLLQPSGGNVGIATTNPTQKLDVAGGIHTSGQIYGDGSATTYGTISMNGSKNGWSGINFLQGGTNAGTFMIHPSGYSGVFTPADNAWSWYWLNGVLQAGTVPAANVSAGTFGTGMFTFTNGSYWTQVDNGGWGLRTNGTIGTNDNVNGWWAGYFVSSNGLGIYSQNSSGYYTQLDNGGYGVLSNGTIQTSSAWGANWAGIFDNTAGPYGIYTHNASYNIYSYLAYATWGLYTNGNVGAASYTCISDERLKKNIHPITNALDKVQRLNGVTFNWKKSGDKDIGVVAQNVEKVLPELVVTGPDGMKSVKYSNMVALLIEAVKEQQKEINKQHEEIEELKKKVGGEK